MLLPLTMPTATLLATFMLFVVMKISWVKKLLHSSAKWQCVIGEDIDLNKVILKHNPLPRNSAESVVLEIFALV